MLNYKNLDDKTFEEAYSEAVMQIPLYSKEWTNHNPSDPGITILEILTAFETIQRGSINHMSAEVRQNLLKMTGFEAARGKCARLLLAAEGVEEPFVVAANQRFLLGDLSFETNRMLEIGSYRLMGIYGMHNGSLTDYTFLTDREVQLPAAVFGEHPAEGDSIWFAASGLPGAGEDMIFYVTCDGRFQRNPSREKTVNVFADMKWECYTEDGYLEMSVRDMTGAFLTSGEIRLRMPRAEGAPCPDLPGSPYVIRATLTRAEYDIRPRLTGVDGFLFEVWQKDTKAACHSFNKVNRVPLVSDMAEEGNVLVFCREERGSSYRKYEIAPSSDAVGRYFELEREGFGMNAFCFDKKKFGYGPEKQRGAVRIVVYSNEIIHSYDLGTVLGFDDQEIVLPMQKIVADSFTILARREDENGEKIYDFVRPERYGEDEMTYHLLENEGKIIIEDAGAFVGARLFVAGLSINRGEEGNIRSRNYFRAEGVPEEIRFFNPGPGTGGAYRETLQEVRKRFLEDIRKPYAAVTASDYERIVRETPQLCIEKVKAVFDGGHNKVQIAVMPQGIEAFPKLSPLYKKLIMQNLESHRLLTTAVEVLPPVYVPVNVQGMIYVKRYYENCREQIEQTIRERIDYIHSDRNFGDVLKFSEVFHAVEELECVESIYDLSLRPKNASQAKMQEEDIVPKANCLCCVGTILIELSVFSGENGEA